MEAFAATDLPPPVPLGQLLAAERERHGMSRADAAQRLHMSAWQIEALEIGDYERLPKGTFLRGFVRNYTKLLGLNSQAALDALAHVAPASPAPGIVVPSQNIRFDPLGDRLSSPYVKAWTFAGVAFALALAATYWWIFVRPAPPVGQALKKEAITRPQPENLAAAPVPAAEAVAPRDAPRLEPPPREQENVAPRPVRPPDVVPAAVSTPAARPAPGARTVKLRFKGPSWVEIRERSGKVLLQRLNEPGSEAEVSGRPPFSVVVGNAPDVVMLYDDREFSLEPHTKVAVARFTLE
jgi:cytoskeleton protein RodZ